MGSLKLRVTIIGGSIVRVLYGTRFHFNRIVIVTGVLLCGAFFALKWFVNQLDPILFLLWGIAGMWMLTVSWVAGLHLKLKNIEQQLEDHQTIDHIEPAKEYR